MSFLIRKIGLHHGMGSNREGIAKSAPSFRDAPQRADLRCALHIGESRDFRVRVFDAAPE